MRDRPWDDRKIKNNILHIEMIKKYLFTSIVAEEFLDDIIEYVQVLPWTVES
jgi:hypothetical protein